MQENNTCVFVLKLQMGFFALEISYVCTAKTLPDMSSLTKPSEHHNFFPLFDCRFKIQALVFRRLQNRSCDVLSVSFVSVFCATHALCTDIKTEIRQRMYQMRKVCESRIHDS